MVGVRPGGEKSAGDGSRTTGSEESCVPVKS